MSFHSATGDEAIVNTRRHDHVNDVTFHIDAGAGPTADFVLGPGQGLVWDAGAVLIADGGLRIGRWPGRGREMALAVNTDRTADHHVYVGSCPGGRLGAFDLGRHGNGLLFARRALAGMGPGVAISRFGNIAGSGRVAATADSIMLQGEGDGWLFLSTAGRVIERRLAAGEAVTVGLAQLVAMTAAINIDAATGAKRDSIVARFVRLTGPGRIWVQASAAPDVEHVAALPQLMNKPRARPVLDIVR